MCSWKFDKKSALVPRECLVKYGKVRAHKVCGKCWWSKFALEGVSHKCPGCANMLPIHKDPDAGTIVDLTEGTEGSTEGIEGSTEGTEGSTEGTEGSTEGIEGVVEVFD